MKTLKYDSEVKKNPFSYSKALPGRAIFLRCLITGVFFSFLFLFSFTVSAAPFCPLEKKNKTIVIDPGHGGSQSGAESVLGDVEEKDLNLKLARYLKEELHQYKDLTIYMTREDDRDVGLSRRSEIAQELDADLLVSLHNNAYDGKTAYDHGAFVLASKGNYKQDLACEEQKLACNILHELSKLGIVEQGILLRESETGQRYPNGYIADYYRIIKDGIINGRNQVLIEHAFVDHEEDYENFLSTDEALHRLAKADALGIARYLGLERKDTGTVLKPLKNYKEKLVTFKEGNQTEEETKIFYADPSYILPLYKRVLDGITWDVHQI